ncbi:hypothetical protein [Jannaschia sp. CCS1]|uniref:hypothetical protein n=1 Tax=Jannaschia sp. (strain CCS1) TaxID=290400 RepID=UPI00030B309A|nr:hypothetical protein [Jannaschia sp. CCS1]
MSAAPADADDLRGRDDPDVQTALAVWLDGDDATSLPRLSQLAIAGNRAARLFLARIEMVDRGHSDFRLSLSLQEVRDLFRAPPDGGVFRQTWFSVEREAGNHLAALLSDATLPMPNLPVISALRAAGEHQATDHPTRIIGFNGSNTQRHAALESGLLLPELVPYVQFHMDPEPLGDGLTALRHIIGRNLSEAELTDPDTTDMARLMSLGFGYQAIERENIWFGDVSAWLMSHPSMQPIANLCAQTCGNDADHCAMTVMALTAGYYEVIRLDSPLENVISQARFLSSLRAQNWALRRAALTAYELTAEPFEIDAIRDENICVADMIAQVRSGR